MAKVSTQVFILMSTTSNPVQPAQSTTAWKKVEHVQPEDYVSAVIASLATVHAKSELAIPRPKVT